VIGMPSSLSQAAMPETEDEGNCSGVRTKDATTTRKGHGPTTIGKLVSHMGARAPVVRAQIGSAGRGQRTAKRRHVPGNDQRENTEGESRRA